MKMLGLPLLLLFVANLAQAVPTESAWDLDSCMENVIREFNCTIDGKSVAVDLQTQSAEISFKAADGEKIYGLFVGNVEGGKLYISCDDSDKLTSVEFEKRNSVAKVICE